MDGFTKNDQRAVLAEFLGTMFFVFLGTGAVVAAIAVAGGGLEPAAFVGIAIAHGLGILIAVAWTANLSGGHINPAVTLAMIVTKNIKAPLGVAYMIAQFAGAAVGSLLLKLVTAKQLEGAAGGNLGLHGLAPGLSKAEGLGLEIICTAFLVVVIFNTAVSKKGWGINAPIAIGLAVMLIHFVAVPFTGASVNPARSFGPALVDNDWTNFWIYIVGPAVGALIVAFFWEYVWKNLGDDSLADEPAPAKA
ncbi:MAG: MIP family channel protein [bacterium]